MNVHALRMDQRSEDGGSSATDDIGGAIGAAEIKADEPATEVKANKADVLIDEPAAETKADNAKAGEPVADVKADEPVAEAKADEPATEAKADEPAVEATPRSNLGNNGQAADGGVTMASQAADPNSALGNEQVADPNSALANGQAADPNSALANEQAADPNSAHGNEQAADPNSAHANEQAADPNSADYEHDEERDSYYSDSDDDDGPPPLAHRLSVSELDADQATATAASPGGDDNYASGESESESDSEDDDGPPPLQGLGEEDGDYLEDGGQFLSASREGSREGSPTDDAYHDDVDATEPVNPSLEHLSGEHVDPSAESASDEPHTEAVNADTELADQDELESYGVGNGGAEYGVGNEGEEYDDQQAEAFTPLAEGLHDDNVEPIGEHDAFDDMDEHVDDSWNVRGDLHAQGAESQSQSSMQDDQLKKALCDPAMAKHYGASLVHVAAASGNINVLKQIVDEAMGQYDRDAHAFDPRDAAFEVCSKEDIAGRTPLTYAIMADSVGCAKALLEFGVDINAADEEGQTATHWAALGCRKSMVELLLSHGADCTLVDGLGCTFLHWACLNTSQVQSISNSNIAPLFVKMACKQNLDLRCVLISDPSTLGAGAKTRLESRIKKFTPQCVCRLSSRHPQTTSSRVARRLTLRTTKGLHR